MKHLEPVVIGKNPKRYFFYEIPLLFIPYNNQFPRWSRTSQTFNMDGRMSKFKNAKHDEKVIIKIKMLDIKRNEEGGFTVRLKPSATIEKISRGAGL